MKKGPRPIPPHTPSAQHKHAGGAFKSENQRRFMWVAFPKAAKKTARWQKTRPADFKTHGPYYDPVKGAKAQKRKSAPRRRAQPR